MKTAKLSSDEREIRGKWILAQGKLEADESCHRIIKLIREHLQEIGSDASGWERLYRDPDDGRFWELTYPEGELHGGGPPLLLYLTEEEAKIKYKHLFD
jgi:immunity protein 27 of polymorphic toxin system